MKKTSSLLLVMLLIFLFTGTARAQTWRTELHAGTSSVFGGMDYKGYLRSGYYRMGGDFVYNEDSDEEYRIADGRFTVGSDSLAHGLQGELGFKFLLGNVENGTRDGDIGAIGFLGRVAYFLPGYNLPLPIRLSATVAGAPSPLSLVDLDNYSEVTLDAGFFVVENAALVLGYRNQHFKMENSGGWKTSEDSFTIGIELNF